MKTIYYLLLSLFVVLFCACNHKKKGENIARYSININVDKISEFNIEDVATFHSMIPLETSDEVVIGKIQKVFLTDSLIIVWDKWTNKIFVFDSQGNYKYKIGNKGQGPEEYVRISDVYFDEEKHVISISDTGTQRIVNYDLQGHFLSSERTGFQLYFFIPDNGGYWGINGGQNPNKYDLLYIKDADIKFGFFPIVAGKVPLYDAGHFSKVDNSLFFHSPYSNVIYKIEEENLTPYINIDFGDKGLSYEKLNPDKFLDKLNNSTFFGSLHNVFFNKDWLFFSFNECSEGKQKWYNCYTSLNSVHPIIYDTNTIKHAKEAIQSAPKSDILNLSHSKLIFQIRPHYLSKDAFDELNTKYGNIITTESNPILVFYELKENK
jgi:hypothetical protein